MRKITFTILLYNFLLINTCFAQTETYFAEDKKVETENTIQGISFSLSGVSPSVDLNYTT